MTGRVPVAHDPTGLYKKREDPTLFSLFTLNFQERDKNALLAPSQIFPNPLLLVPSSSSVSSFYLLILLPFL